MATTKTALSSDAGATIQIVIAIEGYEYLLTDGPTARAVTAWSGTGWTLALTGTTVTWDAQQELDPFARDINPSFLAFRVMDTDGTDAFGIAVHAGGPQETELNGTIDSDATTITVKSTASFAASGSAYVDSERFQYTGKTGTTFTTCTRGTRAPFKADTESEQRFGRPHTMFNAAVERDIAIPPKVGTKPRQWLGRMVGVWLHNVEGNALNSRADAQCVFAGRIVNIRDNVDGTTLVECQDILADIRDGVLLRDQFNGRVAEGIFLERGLEITLIESPGLVGEKQATLTVVSSGASGADEIDEGRYLGDEIVSKINEFAADAFGATSLSKKWVFHYVSATTEGPRGRITITHSSSVGYAHAILPTALSQFLGWGTNARIVMAGTSSKLNLFSPEEPYRLAPAAAVRRGSEWAIDSTLEVTDSVGTWFLQGEYLPQSLRQDNSERWGLIQWGGGALAPVYFHNDGSIEPVVLPNAASLLGNSALGSDIVYHGVRYSSEANLTFKQVILMEGTFHDLVTKIMASTGTAGYNHATYDAFPEQMGLAIPWELLDDAWVDGLKNLSQAQPNQAIVLWLDKPTRFWDAFSGDFSLRLAVIIWRDEALRISSWSTPVAGTATRIFTESNKAANADSDQEFRTPLDISDRWLFNTIKVRYNRDLQAQGQLRDAITITDAVGVAATGGVRALTIEAKNSIGTFKQTGTAVEQLAATLAAWLPFFSRPTKVLRRSINQTMICELGPGDHALVSDDFARNPTSGERGMSSEPALVTRVHWNLGGASGGDVLPFAGEVDLVIAPIERVSPYSPSARVDETANTGGFTAGYDSVNFILRTKQHEYSLLTEALDATNFDPGDKIRIVQRNTTTPIEWTRTVGAQSGTDITLTSALSSPAFDSAATYVIVSDTYSNAQASQREQAYQADDADALVQDLTTPYSFGYNPATTETPNNAAATPRAVSIQSTVYAGDGRPMDVATECQLVVNVNNFVSYQSAINAPSLSRNVVASGGGVSRALHRIMPICIGPTAFSGRWTRMLTIKPWVRNTSGSGRTVFIYLAAHPPRGTSRTKATSTSNEYSIIPPFQKRQIALAGSADWAAPATPANFLINTIQVTGVAYIIMEAEADVESRGFAEVYLGPLIEQ